MPTSKITAYGALILLTLGLGRVATTQKVAAPPAGTGAYCVLQVGDTLSVVRQSQISWARRRVSSLHRQAMARWNKQKKAARAAGEKFATPKPKRRPFRVRSWKPRSVTEAEKLVRETIWKAKKRDAKSRLRMADGGGIAGLGPVPRAAPVKKRRPARGRRRVGGGGNWPEDPFGNGRQRPPGRRGKGTGKGQGNNGKGQGGKGGGGGRSGGSSGGGGSGGGGRGGK